MLQLWSVCAALLTHNAIRSGSDWLHVIATVGLAVRLKGLKPREPDQRRPARRRAHLPDLWRSALAQTMHSDGRATGCMHFRPGSRLDNVGLLSRSQIPSGII